MKILHPTSRVLDDFQNDDGIVKGKTHIFMNLDSRLHGNDHYSPSSLLKSHPAAKAGIWMVNQASIFMPI